jgi:hypothetical protein
MPYALHIERIARQAATDYPPVCFPCLMRVTLLTANLLPRHRTDYKYFFRPAAPPDVNMVQSHVGVPQIRCAWAPPWCGRWRLPTEVTLARGGHSLPKITGHLPLWTKRVL